MAIAREQLHMHFCRQCGSDASGDSLPAPVPQVGWFCSTECRDAHEVRRQLGCLACNGTGFRPKIDPRRSSKPCLACNGRGW